MAISSCDQLMLLLLSGVVAALIETNTVTTGRTVWPHPKQCAQFYNSSAPAQRSYWEDHLQECPHPQVFDAQTLECKHYTEVDCGNRTEPLGPCDYKVQQCWGRRCSGPPCYLTYPDCKGLPDGYHWQPEKLGSPFFMYCQGGRNMWQGNCMTGKHYLLNRRELR